MVLCLPRRGSVATGGWNSVEAEVVSLLVAVETQRFFVSIPAEEGDDPLLLLGREHPLAVVVAVGGGVPAQETLDLVAKGRVVFLFHFGEEGVESVGRPDDACPLVHTAVGSLPRRGIDGIAAPLPLGDILTCQEAGAAVRQRAVAKETAGERGWNLIECRL